MDREKVTKDSSNNVLLHFGYGKHRCLGEKFASQTIKLGIYRILTELNIKLKDKQMPNPNYAKASGAPFAIEQVPVIITAK